MAIEIAKGFPHLFLIHSPTHRVARDHHLRRACPSRTGSWRTCTTTSPSRGFITRTDTPRTCPRLPLYPTGSFSALNTWPLFLAAPTVLPRLVLYQTDLLSTFALFPPTSPPYLSTSRSQSLEGDEEVWDAKRHALEHYERARDTYQARLAAKAAGRLDVLSKVHPTSLTQGKGCVLVARSLLLPPAAPSLSPRCLASRVVV